MRFLAGLLLFFTSCGTISVPVEETPLPPVDERHLKVAESVILRLFGEEIPDVSYEESESRIPPSKADLERMRLNVEDTMAFWVMTNNEEGVDQTKSFGLFISESKSLTWVESKPEAEITVLFDFLGWGDDYNISVTPLADRLWGYRFEISPDLNQITLCSAGPGLGI